MGPNAFAATHLVFNHAADIVLRWRRLFAAAFFFCGRGASFSGNYFEVIDYYWHLKLLRLVSRKDAKDAKDRKGTLCVLGYLCAFA